jgi:LPXTG-site transpeptidase (sortase) family protein
MQKGMLIELAVRVILAAKEAYARKWSFLAVFLFLFFGSVFVLASLDLLPEASATPSVAVASTTVTAAPVLVSTPELPVKIEIPSIKLAVTISNPTSTNTEVLDHDLLLGAVRYPTSAKLGEQGNVLLFGHSSYLPIVRNQAYKAFNDIQKLHEGDTVTVYSSGTAYSYRVTSFMKQSAQDAVIPLDVKGNLLTLSTCDSFGAKTDRFVVTAEFVESHPISTL